MTRASVVLASALIVFTASACAATARAPEDSGVRPDRNLLTGDELRDHEFSTVFEAVEALRPHWLRERGPDSFSSPSHVQAYLDDSRLGGVETLRALPITNVLFIRHIDGIEATARWGLDHGNGAIFVATHR